MEPPATPRGDDRPELCVDFDGAPACIADARDTATAFLARRAPHAPVTFHRNLLLVVSELVTNAVRHAPGPLTLCMDLVRNGLKVSVEDTSTAPPRPRTPDPLHGTGGFGWPIVQRIAHRVETVTRKGGKTVHAVLGW